MEEKLFVWYDSGDHRMIYDPHMLYDQKLIGKSFYHSLTDLLKMNISDSIKKRLSSSKIGTSVKISYYHSQGDIMVKRIDPTELGNVMKLHENIQEVEIYRKRVSDLDIENRKLMSKLLK